MSIQSLQPTGQANEGLSSYSVPSHVSRLPAGCSAPEKQYVGGLRWRPNSRWLVPAYSQWNGWMWFSVQLGSTAWMLLAAAGRRGSPPDSPPSGCCFAAANTLGTWLWRRRDRMAPYPAYQLLVLSISGSSLLGLLIFDWFGPKGPGESLREAYAVFLLSRWSWPCGTSSNGAWRNKGRSHRVAPNHPLQRIGHANDAFRASASASRGPAAERGVRPSLSVAACGSVGAACSLATSASGFGRSIRTICGFLRVAPAAPILGSCVDDGPVRDIEGGMPPISVRGCRWGSRNLRIASREPPG